MNPVDILLAEENFEEKVNDFEQNFTRFDFSGEAPNDSLWWEVCLKTFVYTVILLVALTGNLLVITTIVTDRSLRSTINFFVANLAAADLVLSAGFMWIPLSNSITGPSYFLGTLLCKLESFAQMTCLTAITLTLTAIVCEQLKAVTFPLQARITQHRNGVVIISIWTVSVLVSIPILLVKKYENYQGRNFPDVSCDDDWEFISATYPLKQLYYTLTTTILFFLPATIMIVLYLIIVRRLHGFQVPGEIKSSIYQQAKKKVIKMACIVIVPFLLSWSLMEVATFYSKVWLSGTQQGELPSWFHHFQYTSMLLVHFNCAANPFLYAVLGKDFRESLWKILKCKVTRQPRRQIESDDDFNEVERMLSKINEEIQEFQMHFRFLVLLSGIHLAMVLNYPQENMKGVPSTLNR
ncbi:neuropeptide Y receptor type 2 [Nephila pilipes]|uniref:Neuropeptide Y receptor type 2 n=1 Tax=Nephila pilipes TaxID=299642 RepID=A0A8X6Q250_NEPPI|nr:neuropeptide Y receptor type 2 [Nephila pilipes]